MRTSEIIRKDPECRVVRALEILTEGENEVVVRSSEKKIVMTIIVEGGIPRVTNTVTTTE